jgi:hypothetical protein
MVSSKKFCVLIEDGSFHGYLAGDILIVERESHHKIKSGDRVIYYTFSGEGELRHIKINEEERNITLLSPCPTVEPLILPISHLKLCDKITAIIIE